LIYIKGSPGKRLLYKKHEYLRVEASSDSNYAGHKRDSKSTSGDCTYVGDNLVMWS